MKRIVLKALNAPILILIMLFGIAAQSALFQHYPVLYLQPDIILLVTVWMALRRPLGEGGVVTLILANAMEIHSGAPQGLFLTSYMLVFLTFRGLSRYLLLPKLPSYVSLALFSTLYFKLLGLLIVYFLGYSDNQWRHTLSLLALSAVMNGVVGIWVFKWLERFDWVTFKDPKSRRLLEDELQVNDEWL